MEGKKLTPPCNCDSGHSCDGSCLVPKWIAERLLKARDAIINNDSYEAYHWLYSIASPDFDKYEPWADLEAIVNDKQS